MIHETGGRVTITWPAADTPPTALPVLGIAFTDPDTGRLLTDVTALRMNLAAAYGTAIEAVLTRLVDTEGRPIGDMPGQAPVCTEQYAAYRAQHALDRPHPADAFPADEFDGEQLRTAEFRYVVAEMLLAARAAHDGPGGHEDDTSTLAEAVTAYLDEHPYDGQPVESGELTFHRDETSGTLAVESEPPDTLGITLALLDQALKRDISFSDGVITIRVKPQPLHYRALYLDGPYRSVAMCERVAAAP